MTTSQRASRNRGFTLVEIMISATIVGVVVSIAVLIVFQALQTYYYDVGRVEVNQDMRKLTRDMTTNAVFSNYFLIYPNFATRSISTGTGSAATTIDYTMPPGSSGDMVLFITDSVDSTSGVTQVSNIVGYYRDGTTNTAGPVRTFTVAVAPGTSNANIYSLLPAVSTQSTNGQVIPLALDYGSYSLFYNYFGRSVMIKSEVLEPGANNRKATSTYNFTVTPRG